MGDRANIVIENDAGRIYLYTHWAGYSLPETLRSALERGKSRWDDESYLTRIIFCEMVKGSEADLTGMTVFMNPPFSKAVRPVSGAIRPRTPCRLGRVGQPD